MVNIRRGTYESLPFYFHLKYSFLHFITEDNDGPDIRDSDGRLDEGADSDGPGMYSKDYYNNGC